MNALEQWWPPSNQAIVGALKTTYPQITSGRFIPSIEAAFPETLGEFSFRRVPDAFTIRQDAREVDIFEAEVTHPIHAATLSDICRFWLDLDTFEIVLDLYVVNRFGHINRVDLKPLYCDMRRSG